MGIDPFSLPDRVKARMDDKDKQREAKRRGKRAIWTGSEALEIELLRDERKDHADFANYLKLKGLEYEHDDPTRRSSNRKGWPDFRIYAHSGSRVLFIEFKRGRNKLTVEQKDIQRYLEAAGFPYVVAYSLSEAIEAVHQYLLQS